MTMMKLIGSLCLITACFLYSRCIYAQFKSYVEYLHQLYQYLYMIKGEIAYTRAPMDEIFQHMDTRFAEPIQSFNCNLMKQVETRNETNFQVIWEKSMELFLTEFHLKEKHKRLVTEFGQQLGQSDYETDIGSMKLILERLHSEIQIEESTMKNKQKLCNYLGIMTGLFIVILLF